MATLRISGVQMQVGKSKKENLPKILEHIRKSDCDFIVFPEMALTGYSNGFSDTRTLEAWAQIAEACRQSYVTAIVGTGARIDGETYIQARVFSHEGETIGHHEKIVPTSGDREWCRPGSELRVFEHRGVNFGCLICNDLWVTPGCGPYPDPRLSYQLGQKGAQVIFHCINSGDSQIHLPYHESNLRLRAMESKVYIATANAAGNGSPINAPSGVVSPEGEWLTQCPLTGEGVYTCDIEID